MALYRRARIYYIKLTSPDGSLIRRSARTYDRRKAQEYHDRLKAELWDLAYLKKKPRRTWDEAALRWLKEKAHKKSYRDDVSRIRWFTGHLRGRTLDQISRDSIDQLISRGLSRRSDRTKDLYVALIAPSSGRRCANGSGSRPCPPSRPMGDQATSGFGISPMARPGLCFQTCRSISATSCCSRFRRG